ncbi:MAG TPA: YciI family protein [Candidatus Limnocylindrales bacterium]|nr:YciI family protein [Candidatus Limnocylindrales bacterium]
MKFVMFTYVGEQGVAEWEAMPADERAAYVELHKAWFRAHGKHVRGGEELASPATGRTIQRKRGSLSSTDGPFIETKELLGGFIILEAQDLEAALAMAGEWPALGTDGNGVEVRPTDSTG